MPITWKLGAYLEQHGVTPLELARRMGVTHPGIYRLAKRTTLTRITGAKLHAICKALGCQPGDLMEAPDIPPRRKSRSRR